jgi:hypothetical protein
VAHTYNPSNSRSRDQENHGSKPARARGVAQGECPEFKPQYRKKNKKNKKKHISTKNFLKAHVYLRKVYVKFY